MKLLTGYSHFLAICMAPRRWRFQASMMKPMVRPALNCCGVVGAIALAIWSAYQCEKVISVVMDMASHKVVNLGRFPAPIVTPEPHYTFGQVKKAFYSKVNFYHLEDVNLAQFKSYVVPMVPPRLRKNSYHFSYVLRLILKTAHKYEIDPFWALSVLWTESNFNHLAVSPVGARGLMQIMPATGGYLKEKLKNKLDAEQLALDLYDPSLNIELGIYYLRYLKGRFEGNLKYATIAYNMGPYWVLKRMRLKRPIGKKNLYYDKVTKHYALLTRSFLKSTLPIGLARVKNLVAKGKRDPQREGDRLYWAMAQEYAPYKYSLTNYVLRKNRKIQTYYLQEEGPKLLFWRPFLLAQGGHYGFGQSTQ